MSNISQMEDNITTLLSAVKKTNKKSAKNSSVQGHDENKKKDAKISAFCYEEQISEPLVPEKYAALSK